MPQPQRIVAIFVIPMLLGLGSCRQSRKDERTLTLFCTASTSDVVSQLGKIFEKETGIRLRTSAAASSILAKQIAEGAPADVFLSANPQWMNYLEKRGLIQRQTRRDLLSNQLVLVSPTQRKFGVKTKKGWQLASAFAGRLAVGDPAHVPAGQYAMAALRTRGWYRELQHDVRAALSLVETGEAAAGIVYKTDAAASNKVAIIETFPSDARNPIRYPIALVKNARPESAVFLSFLTQPHIAELLRAAGFTPLPAR